MDQFAQRLRELLPAGCGTAVAAIASPAASRFAGEEALVAAAAPKRRREFRAGRSTARRALADIGGPAGEILARPEGDPIWPAGFVGSITHADTAAAAIAAPTQILAGIGLDLELADALDDELKPFVCRADERTDEPALVSRGIDVAKLRFVAKEAWFKAAFPLVRQAFDFLDVRVIFEAETDSFRIEMEGSGEAASWAADPRMVGRFLQADGLVAATAYFQA